MRKLIVVGSAAAALAVAGCGGGSAEKTKTTNVRGYSSNGAPLAKSDYATKIKVDLDRLGKVSADLAAVGSNPTKSHFRDLANQSRTLANHVSALNPPAAFQADNAAVATYARKLADTVDKLADSSGKAEAEQIGADFHSASQEFAPARADLKAKLGI